MFREDLGFPGGSDGKESTSNAGDLGLIPGSGRDSGGGHGNHSNVLAWRIPMDRGACQATVHGVAKSQTQLTSEQMLLEKWGWQIWSRGFPSGSVCKEPTCNAGDPRDMGSIPGLGRSLGGGHSNLLRYFGLKNPLDRGAWRATVHRVTKSQG